jgi:hypothetical protein
MHVSGRAVDHTITVGVSGVGDGCGGSAMSVRRRRDYVGGYRSVNSVSPTTSAASAHHVGSGCIALWFSALFMRDALWVLAASEIWVNSSCGLLGWRRLCRWEYLTWPVRGLTSRR